MATVPASRVLLAASTLTTAIAIVLAMTACFLTFAQRQFGCFACTLCCHGWYSWHSLPAPRRSWCQHTAVPTPPHRLGVVRMQLLAKGVVVVARGTTLPPRRRPRPVLAVQLDNPRPRPRCRHRRCTSHHRTGGCPASFLSSRAERRLGGKNGSALLRRGCVDVQPCRPTTMPRRRRERIVPRRNTVAMRSRHHTQTATAATWPHYLFHLEHRCLMVKARAHPSCAVANCSSQRRRLACTDHTRRPVVGCWRVAFVRTTVPNEPFMCVW